MPVCVFTYHAYLSWLPDHPKGYVTREEGVLPPNEEEAERYRERAKHDEFSLTECLQHMLIDEAKRACGFQKLRLHLVATEPTHIHVLVSWKTDKTWERVRDGLKTSFTRAMRQHFRATGDHADRPFFSDGSSRKRIRTQAHYDHWMNEYGPSHSGWKWREDRGLFH